MDDLELIKNYLQGEEKSFEVLLKRHLNGVYSFIYKFVNNSSEAEDLTQDVFLKAWRNLSKFDIQKAGFKTWLYAIAKNSAFDWLKKKKDISFSDFLREDEDGQSFFEFNLNVQTSAEIEKKIFLSELLSSLDDDEKQIILMKHQENLSFSEIALFLKKSVNTIKSRYQRALAKLRKNF